MQIRTYAFVRSLTSTSLHCSTFFRSAAYAQWHLGYLTLDKTHFSSHLKMSLVWPSVVISWWNSEFVSFRMWPLLHCLAAGHSFMCVCVHVCVSTCIHMSVYCTMNPMMVIICGGAMFAFRPFSQFCPNKNGVWDSVLSVPTRELTFPTWPFLTRANCFANKCYGR